MEKFRASQVYIRVETRRLLRAIAKARGRDETVDEVADDLLHKAILGACPELKALINEADELEDKMVTAIRKVSKPWDGTEQ